MVFISRETKSKKPYVDPVRLKQSYVTAWKRLFAEFTGLETVKRFGYKQPTLARESLPNLGTLADQTTELLRTDTSGLIKTSSMEDLALLSMFTMDSYFLSVASRLRAGTVMDCNLAKMPKDLLASILYDLWAPTYLLDRVLQDQSEEKILQAIISSTQSMNSFHEKAEIKILDTMCGSCTTVELLVRALSAKFPNKKISLSLNDISEEILYLSNMAIARLVNIRNTMDISIDNTLKDAVQPSFWNGNGKFDIILLVDALSQIRGNHGRLQFLGACFEHLSEGGILLVGERDPPSALTAGTATVLSALEGQPLDQAQLEHLIDTRYMLIRQLYHTLTGLEDSTRRLTPSGLDILLDTVYDHKLVGTDISQRDFLASADLTTVYFTGRKKVEDSATRQ